MDDGPAGRLGHGCSRAVDQRPTEDARQWGRSRSSGCGSALAAGRRAGAGSGRGMTQWGPEDVISSGFGPEPVGTYRVSDWTPVDDRVTELDAPLEDTDW